VQKKICLIFFVSDEHISSDEEDSPRIINSKFKIEIDSIQLLKKIICLTPPPFFHVFTHLLKW
jgi:hypothetical protein